MANEKLTDWLKNDAKDCGVLAPPMEAQMAVDFLQRKLKAQISVPTEKGEPMYQSPIKIIEQIQHDLLRQEEDGIYRAIAKVGVDVDKEELLRALQYDRGQYEKGFRDGQQKWISVKDRLPENREDVLVVAFWHERWNVQWGWYTPNGKVWHAVLEFDGVYGRPRECFHLDELTQPVSVRRRKGLAV